MKDESGEVFAPCTHDDSTRVVMGRLTWDYDPPRAFVRVENEEGRQMLLNPTVSDFLQAVSEAFDVRVVPADAIVHEPGALPEVKPYNEHGDLIVEATVYGGVRTPEYAEAVARRWLAMAEYLRTHPPVDEAEVERLQRLITSQPGWTVSGGRLARDLYLAGVRAPEVTP